MNSDNAILVAALILFITNILFLLVIIAPIMFQVFQILKRFNQLLESFEKVTNDWNRKGQDVLSFFSSGKVLKAVKNIFKKSSKEKGE